MTDRLISANKFAEDIYRAWELWEKKGEDCFVFSDIITPILVNQPTVEAKPIKHGKWVWKDYYSVPGDYYPEDVWECDLCGKSIIGKKENYCPNCGADMEMS